MIVDVKRAITWVKDHIAEYGGNPDFVVITGGSAGGHLSSLAALTPNAPEFQPGFEDRDTTVQACVPFYGVYDFTNRDGVGRGDMRGFLERMVMKSKLARAEDVWDAASPMSRVGPAAPPTFVIHGRNDTLVPVAEARLFVQLLREVAKNPVAYAELPGAQHAFEVFSSIRPAHVINAVERFVAYVYSEFLRTQPLTHSER
jgi:acetyl esterase/lipase